MDGPELDWMTVREVLRRCGVRGPNLERLIVCPELTTEEVIAEWRLVLEDRRLRKPAAVLVSRLADRFTVNVQGYSAAAQQRRVVASLEKERRKQATGLV